MIGWMTGAVKLLFNATLAIVCVALAVLAICVIVGVISETINIVRRNRR